MQWREEDVFAFEDLSRLILWIGTGAGGGCREDLGQGSSDGGFFGYVEDDWGRHCPVGAAGGLVLLATTSGHE